MKKNKRKTFRILTADDIISAGRMVNGITVEQQQKYLQQLREKQPYLWEFFETVIAEKPMKKDEYNALFLIVYLSVASSTRNFIAEIQFQTIDQTLRKYTETLQRVSSLGPDENASEKDIDILLARDSQPLLYSFVMEQLEEQQLDEGMSRCFFRVAVEVLGRRCV